ncbi:hypothetical protein [Streptomyces sp. NPDC055287]
MDDLHFLRWRAAGGVEVSNHFKYVANEFPVTLPFVVVPVGPDSSAARAAEGGNRRAGDAAAPSAQPTRRQGRFAQVGQSAQ